MNIVGNPSWSKEDIAEFLEREKPGYQKIFLPYGLSTKGKDRPNIRKLALSNIRGKSFLDLGSCYGKFCLEALQGGAEKAVGIELSRPRIEAAKTIADILGLNPEYRFEDIETADLSEKFDVSVCLDVLHHLRNPYNVIQQLTNCTRERLIIEVASPGRHDRRKFNMGPIKASMVSSVPSILVGPYDPMALRQTYFFTRSAMKNILGQHRRVFRTVETIDSPFKDRFIVVADKQHIGRMVLVCGLTSAGKTTFKDGLKRGEHQEFVSPIDMSNVVRLSAKHISRKKMSEIFPSAHCENVLFHYDISRRETLSTYSYDRDVATDLVTLTKELDIVVVAPEIELLQAQLQKAEFDAPNATPTKKHLMLKGLYQNPDWVAMTYRDFIDYCAAVGPKTQRYTIVTRSKLGEKLFSAKSASEAKKHINKIYSVS